MAYGDIDSMVGWIEADTESIYGQAKVFNLFAGYYLTAYNVRQDSDDPDSPDTGEGLWIQTFHVDTAGQITLIDKAFVDNYAVDYYSGYVGVGRILTISGNVRAIAAMTPGAKIYTITVTDKGIITKVGDDATVIDTYEPDDAGLVFDRTNNPDLCWMQSSVYLFAYMTSYNAVDGLDGGLWIDTITINANGTIDEPYLDTLKVYDAHYSAMYNVARRTSTTAWLYYHHWTGVSTNYTPTLMDLTISAVGAITDNGDTTFTNLEWPGGTILQIPNTDVWVMTGNRTNEPSTGRDKIKVMTTGGSGGDDEWLSDSTSGEIYCPIMCDCGDTADSTERIFAIVSGEYDPTIASPSAIMTFKVNKTTGEINEGFLDYWDYPQVVYEWIAPWWSHMIHHTGSLYIHVYSNGDDGLKFEIACTRIESSFSLRTYPTEETVRVSSITHKYNRGVYNMELGLGEVVAPSSWVADIKKITEIVKEEEPLPTYEDTTISEGPYMTYFDVDYQVPLISPEESMQISAGIEGIFDKLTPEEKAQVQAAFEAAGDPQYKKYVDWKKEKGDTTTTYEQWKELGSWLGGGADYLF